MAELQLTRDGLFVCQDADRWPVPVGKIDDAYMDRVPDPNPYGDGGRHTWDEFELFEGTQNRSWVKHTMWEDVAIAGVFEREPARWLVTRDGGRTWDTGVDAAPGDARSVSKATNRSW